VNTVLILGTPAEVKFWKSCVSINDVVNDSSEVQFINGVHDSGGVYDRSVVHDVMVCMTAVVCTLRE
jgi:hypothetical protein